MKNIVLLRSNPCNPDSRVQKEAFALLEAGYNVHIVCWDRESNHEEEVSSFMDSDIKISRLGYKASFGEGLKNLKSYLRFQFALRSWLRKHRKEYDFVHACDFDTAFFTHKVALRLNKKYVFDLFDFICGEPKNFTQKMIKKAQLNIINKAHGTIICTEDRERQILGSKPRNLTVVHNTPPMIDTSKLENQKKSDSVSFVYVGILQDLRLLKELVEYFKKHPEYDFNVGGFGKYEELFTEASANYENIHFYGKTPYDKTLELEYKSDIMLAIYDPTVENHKFAAPNKFYESLMLGKPVIMVKGTGMSNEVTSNDIGVTIDYSEEGFAKGVQELVQRKSEWEEMGRRSHSLYENKFSWDLMKKHLVDLYSKLEK